MGTELQQLNNNSNTKPNVEETVNIITNRLKERQRELGLPDNIKVDTHTNDTHTIVVIQLLWSDFLGWKKGFVYN